MGEEDSGKGGKGEEERRREEEQGNERKGIMRKMRKG